MLEIQIFNTLLTVILLMSLFVLVVQYRSRNNVIVKAKLLNSTILKSKPIMAIMALCLIVGFLSIAMLAYAVVDEFHSTKAFRDEYAISFLDAINEGKMENMVYGLEGDEKEWGEWVLREINQVKILFYYVASMVLLVILFPIIAAVRIEKGGIRKITSLTEWETYSGYFWREDEVWFLSHKDIVIMRCRIDVKDRAVLDKYLMEETDLNEKSHDTTERD